MFKQLLMHKKFILCTVLFLASSQFNQGAVTSIPGTLSRTVQFPGTHHSIVHSLIFQVHCTLYSTVQSHVFQVHCTVQFSHQYSRHTVQYSSVTRIPGTFYSSQFSHQYFRYIVLLQVHFQYVQSLVFQVHFTLQLSHQYSRYTLQYSPVTPGKLCRTVHSIVFQAHHTIQYSTTQSLEYYMHTVLCSIESHQYTRYTKYSTIINVQVTVIIQYSIQHC